MNFKNQLFLTAVLVAMCVHASGQCTLTTAGTTISQDGECYLSDYVLVFQDEFDGSTLNTEKWMSRPWGSGDPDHLGGVYQTLDNATVNGGILSLTAKDDPLIARVYSWYPDDYILGDGNPNLRLHNFSTAELWTKELYGYGRYEIRCKIPAGGRGFVPAFWTFGGPGWNEIDIFEFFPRNNFLGNFSQSKTNETVSFDYHRDHDNDGSSTHCGSSWVGPDFSASFHTFAMEWDEYTIKWYVDDVKTKDFPNDDEQY